MIDIPCRTLFCVAVGSAVSLAIATPAASAVKRPTIKTLCLPPGGTTPMPCAAAGASSLFEIDAGAVSAQGSTMLIFTEVDAVGRPRVIRVPAAGVAAGRPLRMTVPRQLCGDEGGTRWRVQLVSGSLRPVSVGAVTTRC